MGVGIGTGGRGSELVSPDTSHAERPPNPRESSEYSRCHHARLMGLDGPVIPDPIPLDCIVAAEPEPKYVTFINPQPFNTTALDWSS